MRLPPRDSVLPGLDSALTPSTVVDLLQQHLPDCVSGALRVVACRPVYIRYKPATSCLVHYQLTFQAAESQAEFSTLAHARLYPPQRVAHLWSRRSLHRLVDGVTRFHPYPPLHRAAYLPELPAVVQIYPVDMRLRDLVPATSRSTLRRVLRERLPAAIGGPMLDCDPHLIRYKPERKAVLRYVLHHAGVDALYGKVYADDRGPVVCAAARRLIAYGFPTPAPVLYLPDLHLLLTHAAPGLGLADLRATLRFPHALSAVAAALAQLHALPPLALPHVTLQHDAAVITAQGQAIRTLVPDLAHRAETLAERIARALSAIPPQYTTVHGDFYDDQVLISEHGIAVLDLDEIRVAHPLLDVGNILAHLRCSDPTGGASEAFTDAYLTHHPAISSQLALFEAAALLKLAVGPFRRLEADWPDQVERLINLADRRLTASTRSRSLSPPFSSAVIPLLDPRLPQLTQLMNLSCMAVTLERDVFGSPVAVDAVTVLRHKPGRRCLLRYDVRRVQNGLDYHERLYGKTFASQRGRQVFDILRAIVSARACGADVSLPAPLAFLPAPQLLLQGEVLGTPVAPRFLDGDTDLAERLADALYNLHASGLDLGRTHDLPKELDPLAARVARLGHLAPALSPLAEHCLSLVDHAATRCYPWRWRPIHRDFYHEQILVGRHGLSILDFDDAALSEPAVDVANFLAHLQLLTFQTCADHDHLARVAEAFLRRYTLRDPGLDLTLVHVLQGATLLRLAEIHLPRVHGEWLAGRLLHASCSLLTTANE